PYPDARANGLFLHPLCKARHIGKARISMLIRPTATSLRRKPAGIDHHKGGVVAVWRKMADERCIATDRFLGVIAIGVVPVIAAVDGKLWEPGGGAESTAEARRKEIWGLPVLGHEVSHRRSAQRPFPKVHALSA